MRTVRLEVTLTYDGYTMHGYEDDGLQWFMTDAETGDLTLHYTFERDWRGCWDHTGGEDIG